MKTRLFLLLTAAPVALMAAASAHAQSNAKTVAVCNAQTYTAGQSYPLTQNPAGQLCDTGGAGNISVGNVSLGAGSATIGSVAPLGVANTPGGGTITTGGTFQQIANANSGRLGCLIEDPVGATDTLYVYIGAGTPAYGNSTSIGPGGGYGCNPGGLVLTGNVSVMGNTTGDAFTDQFQ